MELTVLAVPGCPNAPVLEQRLAEALAGRPAPTVARRVIADADEAARWGMRGSPTLLIDGRDPFAVPGGARLWPAGCMRPTMAAWTVLPPSPRCGGRWSRPVRKPSRRCCFSLADGY
jgi:hypothetical protein